MQSGNTVIIKCFHRFDRLQSILYSWWGSRAVVFYRRSVSRRSFHGKYISTLLLKYGIRSTKPDFNVDMKFKCRLAVLYSELLMLCDSIY